MSDNKLQKELDEISSRLTAIGKEASAAGIVVSFVTPSGASEWLVTQKGIDKGWVPSRYEAGDWYSSSDTC